MEFTNGDILETAMRQSAIDAGCDRADFLSDNNVVVISENNFCARKYLELPFDCHLISYGNNIVASVSEKCRDIVSDYIERFRPEHCFETPNMHVLNDGLEKIGFRVCFMSEYFLPDLDCLKVPDCPYKIKVLNQKDFSGLYTDIWSNALCEKRRELDVLGVGAYDGSRLVGLAGCSADCESMWQIGIDVLPEYRRQGIASALTSRLALETLEIGKVPFYCAAWSNIKSVRNALKSGFRPAWVEMTAKSIDFVENLNKENN
ncbi:MAG: GNAT family N-acetyltransferase [Ruminococcus sp.]|nr:GNAT family N-acetyltransferase [Ruminococcus sp.]